MSGAHYRLVIGNKNTSSWSLRPWLAMKRVGISFDEVRINLRSADMKQQILAHSPAGKVPVLWAGDLMIWDSLAILEYLADRHPEAGLWPNDLPARAVARSVAAEMHSGFQPLREHCPMAVLSTSRLQEEFAEPVEANIRRIIDIWIAARKSYGRGGRFLFSNFSAADAMYAPVASRFRTYVPDLTRFGDDGTAQAYVDTIFGMPEMAQWSREAQAELAELQASA